MENLYIGKVVYDSDLLSDNDTTPKNRVKVFISGVTSSGAESFRQPRGITNENTITQQSLDVVGKDVYAYVMQPIMGSGSGANYNASTDILTVADSGDINDLNAQPPAEAYSHVNDGFIGGNNIGTAGVNVTGMAYSPDNRSNAYKGAMSLPGVGANNISVSATGGKLSKNGLAYMMRPGPSSTAVVNVSAKLSSGKTVNSKATFRIKDIPAAMGSVRNQFGTVRMPKSGLANAPISAGLPDFMFDLKLKVNSFKIKVPGQLTIIVNGSRLSAAAKQKLSKAKRGDIINIYDIKASIIGNSYKLKQVLPVNIELTN